MQRVGSKKSCLSRSSSYYENEPRNSHWAILREGLLAGKVDGLSPSKLSLKVKLTSHTITDHKRQNFRSWWKIEPVPCCKSGTRKWRYFYAAHFFQEKRLKCTLSTHLTTVTVLLKFMSSVDFCVIRLQAQGELCLTSGGAFKTWKHAFKTFFSPIYIFCKNLLAKELS